MTIWTEQITQVPQVRSFTFAIKNDTDTLISGPLSSILALRHREIYFFAAKAVAP